MAEQVLVAQVKGPNRPVLLDARLAKALVEHGTFRYATAAVEAETEPAKNPKKKRRTYKRRDMKAEG